MAKKENSNKISAKVQNLHPWRLCTPGRHWVREHSLQIPPNKKNPGGSTTIRHASWDEAIYEFKGGRTTSKKRAQELMNEFNKMLEELVKCGKP